MNQLGEFIKDQRNKRKLKITELSEISGVSTTYISQIENGHRKPSLDIMEKIANALKIEVSDILEKDKDVILIKTNRVSNNIQIHELVEQLENANLKQYELDYIIGQALLTINFLKSR